MGGGGSKVENAALVSWQHDINKKGEMKSWVNLNLTEPLIELVAKIHSIESIILNRVVR